MLKGPYEEFIYKSRYARYIEEESRREDWPETVDRYFNYIAEHLWKKHSCNIDEDIHWIKPMVLNLEVLPSMRALMTAGPALERDATCGYNCAYLPIDNQRAFDEILDILMSGTGVGFSVEEHNVSKLPIVSEHFERSDTTIIVQDSKAGWGRALKELISLLYTGQIPSWDLSRLRPAGARLKVMGGRSSGPEPLNDLFNFAVNLFKTAKGRRLTPLECHDFVCKIAEIVVVGGVRRSALISLSDLSDTRLQTAKSGTWYTTHGHRQLANNSAVYFDNTPMDLFMDEFKALYLSKSGERGIFNRDAATRIVGWNGRRETDFAFGTNPCSEIILRPNQFCNLTTAIIRAEDTLEDMKKKVKAATILGTWQSTLTHFKYLRKVWQDNTEEERLLGVSLNGIMDNELLRGDYRETIFSELRLCALQTNEIHAKSIGIPKSTAITCVKPEGTTSQLADCASGLHKRYAPYYIRRVRQDNKDPLTQFMIDQGVPNEPAIGNKDVTIFSFPQAAPKGAMTEEKGAIWNLELWKDIQKNYTEHKPSITVTVKENEWLDVQAWIWKNMNIMSGISLLPDIADGVVYKQMPYEEISEAEYLKLQVAMPKSLDWSKLKDYEKEDQTTGSREFACVGNVCEVIGSA